MTKKNITLLVTISIVAALIGAGLPLYLTLVGPFGSFGLWPSDGEKTVLILLSLAGLITQIAVFVMLKKWLKLIPFIAGIITFLVFL